MNSSVSNSSVQPHESAFSGATASIQRYHELYFMGHWDMMGPETASPAQIKGFPSTEFKELASGGAHCLVLIVSGEVYALGSNRYGQLGIESVDMTPKPIQLDFFRRKSPVNRISCGDCHSAFLCENGVLYMSGCGAYGRLGIGHDRDVKVPVMVDGSYNVKGLEGGDLEVPFRFSDVACGARHTLAVSAAATGAPRTAGHVFAWGDGGMGRLGTGDDKDRMTPTWVDGLAGSVEDGVLLVIDKVAAGETHSCALSNRGDVFTWGDGGDGRLGVGDEGTRWSPVKVASLDGIRITSISCGTRHTAALSENGKAYVWGCASFGRLGLGGEVRLVDCFIPEPLSGKNTFELIAVGAAHGAAVDLHGRLCTWGDSTYSRLGCTSSDGRSVPTIVQAFQDMNRRERHDELPKVARRGGGQRRRDIVLADNSDSEEEAMGLLAAGLMASALPATGDLGGGSGGGGGGGSSGGNPSGASSSLGNATGGGMAGDASGPALASATIGEGDTDKRRKRRSSVTAQQSGRRNSLGTSGSEKLRAPECRIRLVSLSDRFTLVAREVRKRVVERRRITRAGGKLQGVAEGSESGEKVFLTEMDGEEKGGDSEVATKPRGPGDKSPFVLEASSAYALWKQLRDAPSGSVPAPPTEYAAVGGLSGDTTHMLHMNAMISTSMVFAQPKNRDLPSKYDFYAKLLHDSMPFIPPEEASSAEPAEGRRKKKHPETKARPLEPARAPSFRLGRKYPGAVQSSPEAHQSIPSRPSSVGTALSRPSRYRDGSRQSGRVHVGAWGGRRIVNGHPTPRMDDSSPRGPARAFQRRASYDRTDAQRMNGSADERDAMLPPSPIDGDADRWMPRFRADARAHNPPKGNPLRVKQKPAPRSKTARRSPRNRGGETLPPLSARARLHTSPVRTKRPSRGTTNRHNGRNGSKATSQQQSKHGSRRARDTEPETSARDTDAPSISQPRRPQVDVSGHGHADESRSDSMIVGVESPSPFPGSPPHSRSTRGSRPSTMTKPRIVGVADRSKIPVSEHLLFNPEAYVKANNASYAAMMSGAEELEEDINSRKTFTAWSPTMPHVTIVPSAPK